eukprot:TRINITY_DN7620_c0_g1_i2.p1 TRINITY_DN7620_c0_g1~~TRINITY_DN7620_c0_g1_i2.p1  ORF type:complete len:353 (-),score=74.16 TRINITY_DN7620_c0_g1_i2:98-1156(-)
MDKFCEGLVTHSDQRAPELLELIVETILKTLHILLESPANIDLKQLPGVLSVVSTTIVLINGSSINDKHQFAAMLLLFLLRIVPYIGHSFSQQVCDVLVRCVQASEDTETNAGAYTSGCLSVVATLCAQSKRFSKPTEHLSILPVLLRLIEETNGQAYDGESLQPIVDGLFTGYDSEVLVAAFQCMRTTAQKLATSSNPICKSTAVELLVNILDHIAAAVSVLMRMSDIHAQNAVTEACKLILLLISIAEPEDRDMLFDVYTSMLLSIMAIPQQTPLHLVAAQLFLHLANVDADAFRARVASLDAEYKSVLESAVRSLKGIHAPSQSQSTSNNDQHRPVQKQTIQLKTFGSR